jgi:endoglucanase
MPALSRRAAPPALALLGVVRATGFSVSELYEKNYEDPMEGMWCVGLAASGFEQGGFDNVEQYTPPDQDAIKYFHEQGSNCFRVPITWERLQQSTFGSTDLDPVTGFVDTVKYITEDLEDYAIIVPYGSGLKYNNVNVDMDKFVSLWTAIAKEFAQNERVIFELYNYPSDGCHNGDCGQNGNGFFADWSNDDDGTLVKAWLEWCQGAVDAIRAQSADNYVIVPGLKESSCRDWTGAQFWGESLDGYTRAGNLRLFALKDPSNRTAYGVQQYFDRTLTGETLGCKGHDELQPLGVTTKSPGADELLPYTIAMAQKYNKKLWLTEVASFPDPYASTEGRQECESKMKDYLSTMADSGVFLGYQVWQFGCSNCGQALERPSNYSEDLYTMPEATYNLDWYDLEKYGITSTSSSNTATSVTTSTVTVTSVSTSTCTGCTETTTTVTTATTTSNRSTCSRTRRTSPSSRP